MYAPKNVPLTQQCHIQCTQVDFYYWVLHSLQNLDGKISNVENRLKNLGQLLVLVDYDFWFFLLF